MESVTAVFHLYLGEKTSISSTSGYNVQYNYYANGLLKSVTTDSGSTTLAEYAYNDEDVRIDYGNNAYTAITSNDDPRYMVGSITHHYTGGSTTLDYQSRDMSCNPLTTEDWIGDTTYTYDDSGRLSSANPPTGPIPDQPVGGDYNYDWVGNRLNPPTDPNAMVYNAVDQLIEWPGMYSYAYYPDGSLKEVKNSQGVVVATYTYNENGLLEDATYAGDRTCTNIWDAMGNRIGIEVGEEEYSFVYDVTACVPAVLEEETPNGTVQYYRTPDGELIARLKGEDWQYYHYDELGSTILLTDGAGEVTDSYTYDAWGNVTSHNGITIDNPYQYVGALGYYTHYQCPEVKLLQLGVRFYDPETGRFTQSDPIGDGWNWYGYADGNPQVLVDPWGLSGRRSSGYRLSKQDYKNDKYGALILRHYLYGGGEEVTKINDPDWSTYMMNNSRMQNSTGNYMRNQAAGMKNGEVKAFRQRIHMEIENGEGIIGYHYLHGTNKNAGDFLISGYISKHKNGDVAFVMDYQWNDIIDPNFEYTSDQYKARLARIFWNPKDYKIHISWTDRSVMNSKGVFINGWLSDPDPCK